MSIIEYAILCHVAELQAARDTRVLNRREEYFLMTSRHLMNKIRIREALCHDQTAPQLSARPRD